MKVIKCAVNIKLRNCSSYKANVSHGTWQFKRSSLDIISPNSPLLRKLRAIIFLTYFTMAEHCRNVLSPTKFTMHPRENIFTRSYQPAAAALIYDLFHFYRYIHLPKCCTQINVIKIIIIKLCKHQQWSTHFWKEEYLRTIVISSSQSNATNLLPVSSVSSREDV